MNKDIIEAYSSEKEEINVVDYKEDIEKFFFQIYKKFINLKNIDFKGPWNHFMVNPNDLKVSAIYENGFKNLGIHASQYGVNPIEDKVSGARSLKQNRPTGLYLFGHLGGEEPDAGHLNKSHEQFWYDGNDYANLDEYMLIYQFMYWRFNTKIDQRCCTIISTLDSRGRVMIGSSAGEAFLLSKNNTTRKLPIFGPREVEILSTYLFI